MWSPTSGRIVTVSRFDSEFGRIWRRVSEKGGCSVFSLVHSRTILKYYLSLFKHCHQRFNRYNTGCRSRLSLGDHCRTVEVTSGT